jgi:ketosteroid isomerase-like protein
MKLTASLVGIAALSLITSALSQEEKAASPTPEEKPSTTIEETPTPAREAKATTTPAAQPAAQKKEKPATAAPIRSASPTTAAPGNKMGVEATLKDMENKWEASYAAHDMSVAQSLVANDFTGVYWDGRVMSKSGVISEVKKDKDSYKSAVNEKLAVHSYGPGVAVIIGTAHEKGTTKDGKPFDRTFRFTDTWVQRGSQWQCVASQVMKIKG